LPFSFFLFGFCKGEADVNLKQLQENALMAFGVAFVVCALAFLGLDFIMMNLQGLSLIFHQ